MYIELGMLGDPRPVKDLGMLGDPVPVVEVGSSPPKPAEVAS